MTAKPLVVLVTGVSYSGKTAIAGQLREFGYQAISLDGHPGLCSWTDRHGHPVTRPAHPTLQGLQAGHQWRWNPTVLGQLIAELRQTGADVVWLCGVAANTTGLAALFDLRILLHLDQATMLDRAGDSSRSNDFGRAGQTAQWLTQRFATDQDALKTVCDVTIDARPPLRQVAEELLIQVCLHTLRRATTTHGDGGHAMNGQTDAGRPGWAQLPAALRQEPARPCCLGVAAPAPQLDHYLATVNAETR